MDQEGHQGDQGDVAVDPEVRLEFAREDIDQDQFQAGSHGQEEETNRGGHLHMAGILVLEEEEDIQVDQSAAHMADSIQEIVAAEGSQEVLDAAPRSVVEVEKTDVLAEDRGATYSVAT